MTLLKLIFLLSTWSFTVTATESWMTHYLLKNSSVCLHVKEPPPYRNAQWTFDGELVADKDYTHEDYADRVVFISENLTLCINRLTEYDTGTFKVSYISNRREQLENHRIILQGMVPRPVMTVTPENHSSASAESCNFTVNCSIQDDWLGSICHRNSCRTSQKSFRNVNITIFIENTVVVCSGNNHVSTNNISQIIPTSCFLKRNFEFKEDLQKDPNFYFVIIAIAVVILLTVVVAVIKYCKAKHDQKSTCSAQSIQSGPLESQQLSEPRASTSSSEADPSYENVETSQPRETSIAILEQGLGEVDIVYSVPRKAASSVKSDKKQDENTQKASTSGCADVNKDQSSTQTETVYSVLQMPKNLST